MKLSKLAGSRATHEEKMIEKKTAILYRMVTPEHVCPYGRKAKYLLERQGFHVEDRKLTTRQETDEFKARENVKTTPQTFIDGKRVGGYDDLRTYFGMRALPKKGDKSYMPVLSLFSVAALLALAISWSTSQEIQFTHWLRLFGGFSMCLLAMQKLADLNSFSNSFLNYDLLAQRHLPYAFIYPFLETAAGLGMLGGVFHSASGVIAAIIGLEGAISVVKAVYLDKRELTCACMGGNTNVPLGFVSLTENVLMVAMGLWMVLS